MKYTIKIFFSEEDEGYIAIAEELDSISAIGKTEEEALKKLKYAISLYFEERNILQIFQINLMSILKIFFVDILRIYYWYYNIKLYNYKIWNIR